ncbi:MAG: bifunctional molybdenum cofactor biosynthesis protein MoaC/MoaB [Candidatus Melainabacteria bacterium]|nr:bifunctional molybdenum cofactor biosynthesis protein MoaC/MoaB [Candidatus Melainabacteria bacterium]
MRDISKKITTLREATACAVLKVNPNTVNLIKENKIPKGNPLEVSKVAAIQAAKNTSQIIPYCHPLPVDFISVDFELKEDLIIVTTSVKAIYKTGVEMEALTSASVAALNLYDMLKMLDKSMEIINIKLENKRGGKSDFREAYKTPLRACVLVASDSISQGKKDDLSGRLIVDTLKAEGFEVIDYKIVSDDISQIQEAIKNYTDNLKVNLVMTTGGTGFSPRDNMPEAMLGIIEKEIPGIPEAARAYGQERTPYSMLSRGKSGIRGRTIIVNLPGSKKGVRESLDSLFPGILHAFTMLKGSGHPLQEKEIAKVK